MPSRNPFDGLLRAFDDKELLVDLFFLLHLDEVDHPESHSPAAPILLVPGCIDHLLTENTPGSNEILAQLVRWARPSTRVIDSKSLVRIVTEIRGRYAALKRFQQCRVLPDEDNPRISKTLLALLPDHGGPTHLAAAAKQKIRQYFTTTLAYSQRTGKAVLARGRDFVRFLRSRVAEVELPEKADAIVEKKAALGARIFRFKGGRTTKWFLVIALSVASFPFPLAGVPALALAFTDP